MNTTILISLGFIALAGTHAFSASEPAVHKNLLTAAQNIKIISPSSRAQTQKSAVLSCSKALDIVVQKVTSK
jgi:hypothetical protein